MNTGTAGHPRTMELERPQNVACPYDEQYVTDVVIVGCGFAGLNAAVSAREAGAEVLVIDKGKPGYSGLSPWPSSFRWFDPERGDDADAFRQAMMQGGDYLSNLNWYNKWIKESKGIYVRLTEWGILAQYPKASEAGDFYEREDFVGYRETFDKFDRRKKWIAVLNRYEIPYLEHTMVTDLLMGENKEKNPDPDKDRPGDGNRLESGIAGVLAVHTQSGKMITVRAKAVVLATGGGSFKPTGYPTGGNTFDGEFMAWQAGLPITGKEFEDFHNTPASAPGNVFLDNHWQYLENIWLCGGDITAENARTYAAGKGNAMVLDKVRKSVYGMPDADGSEIQDVRNAFFTRRGGSAVYETDPEEVRSGKMSTPVAASLLAGAATGMCCHLTSGVFCGLDDEDGATAVPGLYVAGDGIHATSPSGAAYPCGVGFTSCFTSIDGSHAGAAAGKYAEAAVLQAVSEETVNELKEAFLAPLKRERGFDPNWARDVLHATMAPYWVSTAKTEATLKAALTQVEYMRDHVIPRLCAASSHDLRLCAEMRHKILSAELKLRAGLMREESRGTHYRSDIPYRVDEDYLCYILQEKTADGSIMADKVPVPDAFAGDITLPYDKRYVYYFPGEPEAKGFTPPPSGFGGKRQGDAK